MAFYFPADGPAAKLCFVRKDYPEQEYGFALMTERAKRPYVGDIDDDSPVERAGVSKGDVILGVNGHLIEEENASHKQTVKLILSRRDRVELLLITKEGEQWYKDHSIPITYRLPNIERHNTERSGSFMEEEQAQNDTNKAKEEAEVKDKMRNFYRGMSVDMEVEEPEKKEKEKKCCACVII